MPFFGPLSLSAPLASGDPRIQQFAEQLRRMIPGLQGLTTYPGPYGGGASAFGFSSAYNPFQGAVPTTLDQALQTLQPITSPSTGVIPESLTGLLAQGMPGRQEVPSEMAQCFPASMRVLMADGSTPSIRDVRVGQRLTAWSWTDRLLIADRVTQVRTSPGAEDLRRLNALRVTGWHRLCVGADLWKRAHDVSVGDGVWGLDPRAAQGVIHTLCIVEDDLPSEPVWTLTVQRAENFFVVAPDDTVWLVHNDGGAGGGGGGGDVGIGPGDPGLAGPTAADADAAAAAAAAAGISPAETAALGGPPGSPAGSAPGMGGGGGSAATATTGEGMGAGTPRSGLASLAAMTAARAQIGGRIGTVAGGLLGGAFGIPGGAQIGAGFGGLIGAGGRSGGFSIGVDQSTLGLTGFGNAPSPVGPAPGPDIGGPAPSLGGTPSAPGGQTPGAGGGIK